MAVHWWHFHQINHHRSYLNKDLKVELYYANENHETSYLTTVVESIYVVVGAAPSVRRFISVLSSHSDGQKQTCAELHFSDFVQG